MFNFRRRLSGSGALLALAVLAALLPRPGTASAAQSLTLTGVLTAVFGDLPSGSRAGDLERYFLTEGNGTSHELNLDAALTAPYGGTPALLRRRVTITGVPLTTAATANRGSNRLTVQSVQPAASTNASTASTAASAQTGTKPWVTVLCRFADATGTTPQPASYFTGLMANNYPGMEYYWREASFGQLSIAGSTVVDWVNLPSPRSTYLPGGIADLHTAAIDCAGAATTINFTAYAGINLIFNQNLDGPAYGGSDYLTLSGVAQVWGVTWMPPWGWSMQSVMAHEMGHGLGLVHSSGPYSATYDSRWDPMSDANDCTTRTATYGCPAVHYIAYDKEVLGWIPASQKYVAPPATSRTVTLNRLGTTPTGSDYEMARIPLGVATQYYTVEARRFIGMDSGVPGEAVVIHKVNTTLSDRQAQVVDADNNGNPNDAGAMWLPGKTFTDTANGITVAVTGATSTGYTVTISTASTTGGGATATQLAFVTQPAGAVAGTAFTAQPVVRALDSTGTLVPTFTGSVTLQLKGGSGASLLGTTTVSAVAGVASFSGLSIAQSGSGYSLTASATGLSSVDSAGFTVTAGGGGSALGVLTSPTPGTTLPGSSVPFTWSAGSAATGYWLYVGTTGAGTQDKYSQSVSGTTATVAGLPTSGGTVYVRLWTDTASGWQFNDYTFTASTTGGGATATQLAFVTQPAGAVAGTAFTAQPVVRALDSTGTLVPTFTGSVTLQLKGGSGASLLGTTTVSAVAGVASFSGLSIAQSGSGYSLTASATGLSSVDSAGFTVTAGGGGSALGVLTSPTPGTTLPGSSVPFTWSAGSAATGYWLYVGTTGAGTQDKYSQSVSGTTATVAGLPTSGGTVYVRLWTDTASGWQFNDYTFTASTTGGGATATQLAFVTQPAGAVAGTAFTAQPVVRALDSTGTLVPTFTGSVTLQLKGGSGASLLGTTTVSAVAGVASFSGLSIAQSGSGYSLTASATGLSSVDSAGFTVTAGGGGSALGVLTSPTPGTTLPGSSVPFTWSAGSAATGYWLYVGTTGAGTQDKYSQSVSGTTATVAGLPTSGGTVYVRLWTDTASGWQFNDYTFTASTTGGGATATQLAFVTQPAGAVAGTAFTAQPVVRALDSTGTLVPTFTGSVTLQLKGGSGASLLGTTTVSAVAGVASFSGLSIAQSGSGYSLTASATGLSSVDSAGFTVTAGGGGSALGVLTSPTPGTTLPGSSVPFTWSAGSAATGYWLYVGTTGAGTQDKYSQSVSGTTATVAGLPTSGGTVYVRLWTDTASGWQFNDYTFTAA